MRSLAVAPPRAARVWGRGRNRAYEPHEVGLRRLVIACEELALSLPKGRLRAFVAAILIAGILSLPASLVSAQATTSVIITSVDTSAFPEIRALAAVSDAGGKRLDNLPATSFQIFENNAPVTISQVVEDEVGLQIAFVLESSSLFAKRDPQGFTRLDFVKTSLIDFATGADHPYMKDGLDDVTLIAPEETILQHSTVGGEIRNALISYQSEFLFETGLFDLIGQAMDAVASTPPRYGMRRVIVVFSSGIASTADAEVSTLAARAEAAAITFHTIIVGPAGIENEPAAENLKGLAALTGGSFQYFDGADSVLPLWDTLVTQRTQYGISYRSKISQSGQQTLQAVVNLPASGSVISSPTSFSLTVQPPVVTLPDPPTDIIRASETAGADPATIDPRSQDLNVQVSFPDGFRRSLTKLQLIVDGTLSAEKTSPPFDTIKWDLTKYSDTGIHGLQVIAVDELGLEGQSDVINVLVTIQTPPAVSSVALPVTIALLGIGVITVAFAALAIALVVYLRRPSVVTTIVREAGQRVRDMTEPYMPIPGRIPPRPKQGKAYLEVIEAGQGQMTRAPIELSGDNVRLGRDETLAQVALPDRSVSRLHARITEEMDSIYFLYDEGSTSGTWVNYNQVPVTGHQLKHGDLINLGRVQLRFMLRVVEVGTMAMTTPVAAPSSSAEAAAPAASPAVTEYSTEPFVPDFQSPKKPSVESTDQGLAPNPQGDVDQTEAFAPSFPPKPRQRSSEGVDRSEDSKKSDG